MLFFFNFFLRVPIVSFCPPFSFPFCLDETLKSQWGQAHAWTITGCDDQERTLHAYTRIPDNSGPFR